MKEMNKILNDTAAAARKKEAEDAKKRLLDWQLLKETVSNERMIDSFYILIIYSHFWIRFSISIILL